mmetsp:Transcript_23081/g.64094  ORF Transcript_23081/g.64094 Transcript_23081/m.64094 type:complete len:461 (-) Transcript_23081:501-1883(-)|eukprot:CAMPEP_0117657576 /NCGR_PEP_ID=MMETSP0804-20121206/5405_1 /TAXON_ID=1074897 /ORGANISM="Tetraselmis astigmatica, Strain CCMP880" /LENGTH=460 /DNA_ID=CAMNT_0005464041 /DNA_START=42 /DNA_END=1424 /DNA_ORIENTATION=+
MILAGLRVLTAGRGATAARSSPTVRAGAARDGLARLSSAWKATSSCAISNRKSHRWDLESEPLFIRNFRAFSCATAPEAGSGLARWRQAAAKVPPVQVLPLGFFGTAAANTAAWYGDRILSAAIARELRGLARSCSPGQLTAIYSAAASNENMAVHIDLLLPPCLLDTIPPLQSAAMQVHDYGTMLEACIQAVADEDPEAVAELARFLVSSVMRTGVDTSADSVDEELKGAEFGTEDGPPWMLDGNPKGRLLELGGELTCERVGGLEHAPVFLAEARIEEHSAQARGGSKKAAEKEAAAAVLSESLAKLGVASPWHVAGPQRFRLDAAAVMEEAAKVRQQAELQGLVEASLTWKPVFRSPEHLAANLKGGEDVPTWFRRKANIHRCLCSPAVFPEAIRSTQAWTGRVTDGEVAMVRVETVADGTRLFVTARPAASSAMAQKKVSQQAHQYILETVDTLPN